MRGRMSRLAGFLLLVLALGACGGSGDGPVFQDVGNLTVSGKVVDLIGRGVANIGVLVDGRGPFLTDATGRFEVPFVRPPYYVIVLVGPAGDADVWLGLTRSDPILTIVEVTDSVGNEASFSGSVTGGLGYPLPANYQSNVYFDSVESLFLERELVDPATGLYDEDMLQWVGPATTNLTLRALEYEVDSEGRAVQYTSYGESPAVASNTLTYINQDVALAPVPSTTVSGTMDIPAGLNFGIQLPYLQSSPQRTLILPFAFTGAATFSIPYPVIPGLERNAIFTASSASGPSVSVLRTDLAAPTVNLMVSVPSVTDLGLPIDGAGGVGYGTEFRITPNPGDRVFEYDWEPDGVDGPRIRVITTGATVQMPDLRPFGVFLPPGSTYEWQATGYGPLSSVDDFAVLRRVIFLTTLVGGDGAFAARTSQWSFTWVPGV